MSAVAKSGAQPIYTRVEGAPYQPGDLVTVIAAEDIDVDDVSEWIGRVGRVKYLEYSCGCGQSFPDDPMIGVKFVGGSLEEFWRGELALRPPR
ncbi:MAG: hypothetical protein ACHREM_08985 [Polyangiales bacterium]